MYKSISIIIPTYNRPRELKKLLASIVRQNFPSFEVIVCDDFSDWSNRKENQKTCQFLRNKIDISYFCNPKRLGAPYSRNQGIKRAKYNLLCLTDDDDEWEFDKLQQQIIFFNAKKRENIGLCYTWAKVVYRNGEVKYWRPEVSGFCERQLLKNNFVPSSSVMIKKECFNKVGLFDESLHSCQDWDMWLRISKYFAFGFIPKFLIINNKLSENSISLSSKAVLGYRNFLKKHKTLFIEYNMQKEYYSHIKYTLSQYIIQKRFKELKDYLNYLKKTENKLFIFILSRLFFINYFICFFKRIINAVGSKQRYYSKTIY